MKLVGGTFGINGGARLGPNNSLEIRGNRGIRFTAEQINSVVANTNQSRGFSVLSFLVVAVLASLVLGYLLAGFGVFIALVIAIATSFRTRHQYLVEIAFAGGDHVTLECTPAEVDELTRLKHPKH